MTNGASDYSRLPLMRIRDSRYKLALLSGSWDERGVIKNVHRIVPSYIVLNLSLTLSQRLLEVSSLHRPAQAPIILADLLAGQEPALLYRLQLLFEPSLQLEPLRAIKAASRSRLLLVLWPGAFEDGKLTYAEPGHPEYKQYRSADLEDVLVIPARDLTKEA